MKIFTLLLCMLWNLIVYSQSTFDCGNNSQSCLNFYKLQSSFRPNSNPFIDIIKIPINIIILAKSDSTGGAYTPIEFANEIYKFDWLNRPYTNTSLPSDPVPGYPSTYWINNTKIQFELNQVYFYNNTTWYNEAYSVGFNHFRNHHFTTHPEATNVINCYLLKHFIEPDYDSAGAGGQAGFFYYNGIQIPEIISKGYRDSPTISIPVKAS